MINQFVSRQFLLFLVTGGFAAVVNFFSRFFLNNWLSYSNSIIIAYLIGMVTAFLLARVFVFKDSERPVHHSAMYFILINILAVMQTWLISIGLAYYLFPSINFQFHVAEVSHAIGIMIPVVTSYLGHKYLTFK